MPTYLNDIEYRNIISNTKHVLHKYSNANRKCVVKIISRGKVIVISSVSQQ